MHNLYAIIYIRRPLLVRGIRLRVSNASLLSLTLLQLRTADQPSGILWLMVLGPGNPLITSKACPTQDSTLITPKACPTQDSRLITPKACPTQDSWSCYLLVLCYLLSLYFIAGISRWGPAAGGEALESYKTPYRNHIKTNTHITHNKTMI